MLAEDRDDFGGGGAGLRQQHRLAPDVIEERFAFCYKQLDGVGSILAVTTGRAGVALALGGLTSLGIRQRQAQRRERLLPRTDDHAPTPAASARAWTQRRIASRPPQYFFVSSHHVSG